MAVPGKYSPECPGCFEVNIQVSAQGVKGRGLVLLASEEEGKISSSQRSYCQSLSMGYGAHVAGKGGWDLGRVRSAPVCSTAFVSGVARGSLCGEKDGGSLMLQVGGREALTRETMWSGK